MKHLLFLYTFLLLFPSLIAQPVPPEFAVSDADMENRFFPDIDTDQNGNYVIVWEKASVMEDVILGQRYSHTGAELGGIFTIENSSSGYAAVAMHSTGSFVVVWSGVNSQGIYARRYNASGNPLGADFRVDTPIILGSDIEEDRPDIAMDGNGNFVVVWEARNTVTGTDAIHGQRFDDNGDKIGSKFDINTNTDEIKINPAVAMNDEGDFVVVWASNQNLPTVFDIYGQYYQEDGTTEGSEFRANEFLANSQNNPAVAMDLSGAYVVVWNSLNQDGSSGGIFGRHYTSENQALGNEFQVNTYTTDAQLYPAIDIDNQGNYVVVWQSGGQDGSGFGIYGQKYDAIRQAIDDEFGVNFYITDGQTFPAVAMDQDCDFIVTWETYDSGVGATRILGRQFNAGEDLPVTCYLDVDGDGFGNPLYEFMFCGTCGDGYVENSNDCNDEKGGEGAARSPSNSEIPDDGIDNDCDGMIDEDALSLRPCNSPTLIDFSGFDGSGVAHQAAAGQLSTQEWAFDGFAADYGEAPFGYTNTSPNFTRGTTNGSGVNQIFGGLYALDALGNQALWIQSDSDVFESGSMTLRICNYSGLTVDEVDLSYDILLLNDADRTNYFNFSYSTDDITYTPVGSLDYASPLNATANATANGLEIIPRSTTLMGLNLADGDCLYLRWTGGTEFSFDGRRDELGIDNISICSTDLPDLRECEDDDLILSATISDMQEHNAAATITADNEITATADVIYTAGGSITLEAGFEVAAGGEFHAYIAACVTIPALENRTAEAKEEIETASLQIYPNPATDVAQINFYLPKAAPVQLQLFDLNGKNVKQIKTAHLVAGQHQQSIPISDLPTGMYYLNLQYDSGMLSKKLLIVRD